MGVWAGLVWGGFGLFGEGFEGFGGDFWSDFWGVLWGIWGFWALLGFLEGSGIFWGFLLLLFPFPCPISGFLDPKSQIFMQVSQNLPGKEGSSEVPLLRVGWSVDFSHSQLGETQNPTPGSPNPQNQPRIPKSLSSHPRPQIPQIHSQIPKSILKLPNPFLNPIFCPVPGEDEFSYGFDGRGLKVENGKFEEFGESFGENDVIGCFAVRKGGNGEKSGKLGKTGKIRRLLGRNWGKS